MVFGKQSSSEVGEKSSSVITRSNHSFINERKPDDLSTNQDNSSSTISKLLPIQLENAPINIMSRYDSASINRSQTIVRDKYLFKFIFILLF